MISGYKLIVKNVDVKWSMVLKTCKSIHVKSAEHVQEQKDVSDLGKS